MLSSQTRKRYTNIPFFSYFLCLLQFLCEVVRENSLLIGSYEAVLRNTKSSMVYTYIYIYIYPMNICIWTPIQYQSQESLISQSFCVLLCQVSSQPLLKNSIHLNAAECMTHVYNVRIYVNTSWNAKMGYAEPFPLLTCCGAVRRKFKTGGSKIFVGDRIRQR